MFDHVPIPDFLSYEFGLLFSAVACTMAAIFSTWGAFYGMVAHRIPRMMLAAAVTLVAVSYWGDWFDLWAGAQMRRGAGWLLWPSIAWTAWSGIRYKRRMLAEVRKITDEHNGDGEG